MMFDQNLIGVIYVVDQPELSPSVGKEVTYERFGTALEEAVA